MRLFSLFEAMFLETNPIPVKKAAEMMGLPAGHVRLPLGALSEGNEEKLRGGAGKVGDGVGAKSFKAFDQRDVYANQVRI